jgi:Gpi18-like mannosyltransferase
MNKLLIGVLLISFVLRISLIFIGYHGDLNNQISWGNSLYQNGTIDFYERESWEYSAPNQPPLTLLMLGSMSALWDVIHRFVWYANNSISVFPSAFIWFWEEKGIILLMKLPSVIADILIGYYIYKYLKTHGNSERKSILVAAVWLFNPIVWYNSSVWGQTDSIVNLLGVLSVFSLLHKKLNWSVFWFTLSILFKGSLLYFAPILIAVAWFQKYKLKDYCVSAIYALVSLVLTSLWFHPQIDLLNWIYDLYTKRFIPGEIGYLTANAFNLWWIIDSGNTLDSNLFFGIEARLLGFVLPIVTILISIIFLRKKHTSQNVFVALSVISITVFLFMTRIHERYLYPFFPYATILLAYINRLWLVYIVISGVHLLNLYHLFWVPSYKPLENLYIVGVFGSGLSIISLIAYIYFLRLSTNRKDIIN